MELPPSPAYAGDEPSSRAPEGDRDHSWPAVGGEGGTSGQSGARRSAIVPHAWMNRHSVAVAGRGASRPIGGIDPHRRRVIRLAVARAARSVRREACQSIPSTVRTQASHPECSSREGAALLDFDSVAVRVQSTGRRPHRFTARSVVGGQRTRRCATPRSAALPLFRSVARRPSRGALPCTDRARVIRCSSAAPGGWPAALGPTTARARSSLTASPSPHHPCQCR